jgi:hypothetical protein
MATSKKGKGRERESLLGASASATTDDGADAEATKTMTNDDSQPVAQDRVLRRLARLSDLVDDIHAVE